MDTPFASTQEFGIPGVVIKNERCSGRVLVFTISNRNERTVSATLEITAFDKDNDPVGNAEMKFSLKGISGDKYAIRINCENNGYFKFKLAK